MWIAVLPARDVVPQCLLPCLSAAMCVVLKCSLMLFCNVSLSFTEGKKIRLKPSAYGYTDVHATNVRFATRVRNTSINCNYAICSRTTKTITWLCQHQHGVPLSHIIQLQLAVVMTPCDVGQQKQLPPSLLKAIRQSAVLSRPFSKFLVKVFCKLWRV